MRKQSEKLSKAAIAFAASTLGAVGFVQQVDAATLQWDADGATPGILDGPGTWNTAGNWWNGTSNTNWVNTTTDVIFGGNGSTGTPGLVKITASTTPKSLTFNVAGYTIEDTSSSLRLILSQTGGVTANEDATIRTYRGAVMLTGSQTFTAAPGKTLTFDNTPEGANILIGGNSTASPIQNIEGGGTVEFKTSTASFTLGVPQTTTFNVNNGKVLVSTVRSTDNAALVIRARTNASTIQAGRMFVGPNGFVELGTGALVIQQAADVPLANQPAGELHLNGGVLACGEIGGALQSYGQMWFDGGELRANRSQANFIQEQWTPGSMLKGPEFMRVSAGGANINTNGYDIGSLSPLLEDPSSLGGAFTKKGLGKLTMAAASTYTGGTTIQAGTLELGNGGTSGSILGDVVNHGTLAFNRSDSVSFTGSITGTGSVTHSGAGATLLTNTGNTYSGETLVTGGLLHFNDASTYGNTSGIVVNAYGAVGLETSSLAPSFIAEINSGSSASVGALALASVDSGSNVDFTSAPLNGANTSGMSVGAIGTINYTGTITPNASLGYRVGGGGTLVLPNTNALTGSNNVTVTNGGTVVVSGSNNYSGSTTIDALTTLSVSSSSNLGDGSATNGIVLNGGTLLTTGAVASASRNIAVNAPGGTIDSSGNDSTFGNIAGAGNLNKLSTGTVTANYVRVGNLNLADGGMTIVPNSGLGSVSKVATLTMGPTAKLDLTDNKLVTSSPLGTHNGTNYTGVSGLVETGRNGGVWNGNGITTSMPDATSGSNYTMLGVASGTEVLGIAAADTGVWAGQTVLGSDSLVMYTYGGDANLSGFVDIDDYGQIDFNASTGGVLTGWFNGDFDYNGIQDIDDYGIIDFVVNIQGAPFATGGGVSISAVPEPASVGVIALAAIGAMGRRRRKN